MKSIKGIILAGGSGSRLHPITKSCIKQLLPIYDKPMIYYPLSTLMEADIKDILIITREDCLHNFKALLGNGEHLGIRIEYKIQKDPKGIAEALIIGEKFLKDSKCVLILGDNIFIGDTLHKKIFNACKSSQKATVFCSEVESPEEFGILNLDNNEKAISIEEKPNKPRSNLAVTGLYIYDNNASSYAKKIQASSRGELEITSLNNIYLDKKRLEFVKLKENELWFDAGTFESLHNVSSLIKSEAEKKRIIGSPEKIALNKGWIN